MLEFTALVRLCSINRGMHDLVERCLKGLCHFTIKRGMVIDESGIFKGGPRDRMNRPKRLTLLRRGEKWRSELVVSFVAILLLNRFHFLVYLLTLNAFYVFLSDKVKWRCHPSLKSIVHSRQSAGDEDALQKHV